MKPRTGTWTLVLLAALGWQSSETQAQTGAARTIGQLEAELERRDALIADLLRRVQALERRMEPAVERAPDTKPARAARKPVPAGETMPARSPADRAAEEAAEEALLERALERSLVRSGGALLRPGQREVEPSVAYEFTQRSGLAFLGEGVASRKFRSDKYLASLGFRAGLPWSSQLEVSVPYGHQRLESVVDGVVEKASDTGVGDVQLGISKQFVNARDGRVAVIAGITWQHATGDSNLAAIARPAPRPVLAPALGSGFDTIQARLTGSARMDPLVFVGALSHAYNRPTTEDGVRVRPGRTNAASLRAILAASPDVSLRSGLSWARTGNTKLDGTRLEGSRSSIALWEVGGSVVLNHNVLFDIGIGIGLTEDSPDVTFGISLPIRF